MFPTPRLAVLVNQVAHWGGNADWISKHKERTYQFAEFVKNHGWTPEVEAVLPG